MTIVSNLTVLIVKFNRCQLLYNFMGTLWASPFTSNSGFLLLLAFNHLSDFVVHTGERREYRGS